jgi:protoporphyrinogen oxidase
VERNPAGHIFPIRAETSMEDFLANRFGKELYMLFFKDNSEKVWGVPCSRVTEGTGSSVPT